MKKLLLKYGYLINLFSFAFVTEETNTACLCMGMFHQPEPPKGYRKFRKF